MRQFSKKIHMVGIGGAGMSPLAEVFQAKGHKVTGSDRSRSATASRLERIGIQVQYDHTPAFVKDTEMLVYSSAIKPDNPERVYAHEHSIPQMRRAEALGEIMRAHFTICIAGTHGKTTTTSLVGRIFIDAGKHPTVLVGGTLRGIESNAIIGDGRMMIAEADEFDRSFLSMYPSIAIITNIEADHLDCYSGLSDIKNAFVDFCHRVPFYGAVIVCADDPGVRDIMPRITRKVITYGLYEKADYTAGKITFKDGKPSFTVIGKGKKIGRVTLAIPGLHNVANACASIAAGVEMGIGFAGIRKSLREFEGVRRRFEVLGVHNGVTIVDDYAHHPGEIRATLDAARRSGYQRIIAVFQPHLYTRTRDFLDQFAETLCGADEIIVTSIYKAREEPIPGVSSEAIVSKITIHIGKAAQYAADKDTIPEILKNKVKSGDVVVFMGAGDIGEVAARFAELMKSKKRHLK
jgi:UDP-N-acetylmuramate--alanine ligase